MSFPEKITSAPRFRRLGTAILACVMVLFAVACGRSVRRVDADGRAGNSGEEAGAAGFGGTGGSGAAGSAGNVQNGGSSGNTGHHDAGQAGEGGAAGDGGGAGGEYGEEECSLDPVAEKTVGEWDAGVSTLRVELTLDGETLPSLPAGASHGLLILRNRRAISGQVIDLGPNGVVSEARVFHGNYDISVSISAFGGPLPFEKRVATDVTITSDETLRFELRTVAISGALTVNGEAIADAADGASRGTLRFRDVESQNALEVELGSTGSAEYGVVLLAGTYDIDFASSNAVSTQLPYAAATRLASDALLDENRSLDFDLEAVNVSALLTEDGATLPDSPDGFRGYLTFRDRETNTTYRFDLGATGPAAISGLVYSGTYDVTFTAGDELPGFPPSGFTRLRAAQPITASTETIPFDIAPVSVSGELSVNGERMPDNTDGFPRGHVSFRDTTTGKVYNFEVGPTGEGRYSGLLLAGTYDVSFKTNHVHQPGLPFGGTRRLGTALVVAEERALDFDLPVLDVFGSVTLHGGALPDSPGLPTRGQLSFRDPVTGSVNGFDLLSMGPATFAGRLYQGTYDVTVDTATGELAGLPGGTSTIVEHRAQPAGGEELSYDLGLVTFGGRVTVNGASMPDSPGASTRGLVAIREKFTNVTREVDLRPTGEAVFETQLFSGSYDVTLSTSHEPLEGLPSGSTTFLATGCLDLDACDAGTDDLSGQWTFVFDTGGLGPLGIDVTETNGSLTGPFATPTDSGYFEDGSRTEDGFTLTAELGTSGCSPLTLHATFFSACGVSGHATCGGFSSYNPHFTGFR
jgi:hypothetical protein